MSDRDGDRERGDPPGVPGLGARRLVRILGTCTVDGVVDGEGAPPPVDLSAMQRTMLARLSLARPGSADIDELIEAIWSGSPPATARTSVHNQMSRIRTRLGADAVHTDAGRYTLVLPTDAEIATSQLGFVEQSVAEGRFAEAMDAAEGLLGWWRGIPLHELADLDGARHERRRLLEVHRSLETLHLEAAVGAGRPAVAIPEAERLVADAPEDEHRWVLLIRALELAGRRGDALGAYERARRTLASQLGISPGAELRAAESSVLNDAGAERVVDASPLVGRSELMDSALQRCDAGEPLLLVGETGIGKSRVIEELARRLRRRGATVAISSCSLHPDTAVATLRELADSLGVSLDDALPPPRGFVSAVTRLADSGADVVLIVDDIDRAGPTSTMTMCTAAAVDGVMLLATATETEVLPSDLTDAAMVLDPLGSTQQAELAAGLTSGQDEPDDGQLEWLTEMSGGNPAILEHMLDDPMWPVGSAPPGPTGDALMGPSPALRDVIRRRLDRLGATTHATLEVAAVCGPSCAADVLAELTPKHGVARAVAASLLVESDDEEGRAVISFRHGAVRRILYDDLSPGRRMEVHHRAAGLLRASGASVESIAMHSLAAAEVDPVAAVEDAFAAARATAGHAAHADSAQWYDRALAACERTDADERHRVAALIGLADSLRLAGSTDQEAALFTAVDAAFTLGDKQLIGDAAFAVLQLGSTTESGPMHARAIDVAEHALRLVEDPDQKALIAGAASLTYSMTGNSAVCRGLFLEAEGAATASATRRHVLPFAYLGLGHPRDLQMRERITDELLDLGRTDDDPVALFEGLQLSFSVGLQRCDGGRVRDAVAESARLIERVGDVGRRWALAYQTAAVAHLDGDLDLAESHAEEALALFSSTSPSRAFAAYGAQILMIRLAQGRMDELIETIEGLVAEQPGVPAWNAALALGAGTPRAGSCQQPRPCGTRRRRGGLHLDGGPPHRWPGGSDCGRHGDPHPLHRPPRALLRARFMAGNLLLRSGRHGARTAALGEQRSGPSCPPSHRGARVRTKSWLAAVRSRGALTLRGELDRPTSRSIGWHSVEERHPVRDRSC